MTSQQPIRTIPAASPARDLARLLAQRIIGQASATEAIVPYVEMHQAGLAPEGRPVGVFLLLGPTGTGKTKTVEALAEVLHGSEKCLVKIDCGEFQMEHEVAKLIGAPPGYLGHRETQPMLTQQKLAAATSEGSNLSIVLFDEVEKAAPSLARLLLGVLDKATLKLGDNTTVNFENSIIFLTSNLGARDMMKEMRPDFGFHAGGTPDPKELASKLQSIGVGAVRKKFSPEFVNRIDRVITYQPLGPEELEGILDLQLEALGMHLRRKLGANSFSFSVTPEGRQFLLEKGTSANYGARELNRTIHRTLLQPLASMVVRGGVQPGMLLEAHPSARGDGLDIRQVEREAPPLVLIVNDSPEMTRFLELQLARAGWNLVTAKTSGDAMACVRAKPVSAVLIDQRLPPAGGLELARKLREADSALPVLVLSGLQIAPAEEEECRRTGLTLIRKPFLASDVVSQIRKAIETPPEGPTTLRMAS
ncbi:MAG: AAA family ATPase [Bryobacteraceae bacterium]